MWSYEKDRAKDKGFEFYFDGYPHDLFVTHKGTMLSVVTALQASEKPHNLAVDLSADDGTVLDGRCSCKVA